MFWKGWDSTVGIITNLRAGKPSNRGPILNSVKTLSPPESPKPALDPSQTPQLSAWVLSLGLRRPDPEPDNSHASNAIISV